MRDVAKLADVSTVTVSRVVNGRSNASIETTGRVLSAISQLDYRPNAIAAALSRNGGNSKRRNRDPRRDDQPSRQNSCQTNRSKTGSTLKHELLLMQENEHLKVLIADLIMIIDKWKIQATEAQALHTPRQFSIKPPKTGKP